MTRRENADVLQKMVLDLIAQLHEKQARPLTENLLRQLLAARGCRGSKQIAEEQVALFEAELKAHAGDECGRSAGRQGCRKRPGQQKPAVFV